MSEAEKERKRRINPFFPSIRKRVDPKVPDKETIMQLMQDLKDEGNDNFRKSNFEKAHEYYYHAIFVIEILERTFYSSIDKTFLGTIYCNAALCSLRLEKYESALEDANRALKCQNDSVKAVYRKALALKGLGHYQQALFVAESGLRMDAKIFDDLVNELKERVASTTDSTAPAKEDPSIDWLKGTNAFVNDKDKKQDKKGKKMAGKKKKNKGQNNASSRQKAEQKQQTVAKEDDSDPDSDSSSSDDGVSISDGAFANSMKNVQSSGRPLASMKGKTSNDTAVKKTASQRDISRLNAQDRVGLDKFEPVPAKSRSNTNSQQKKVNITWPLEKYVFRLVCRLCFYKESEGIGGYKYRSEYQHSCAHNILIIRDKGNAAVDWLKIRPMPETAHQHFSEFKLCYMFRNNQPCRLSEANCTFAHNHVEINLWTMNRAGLFNISAFVQNAAKEHIYTSESLNKNMNVPTTNSNQTIPGLQNSAGAAPSAHYIHPQPQLQQRKAPPNVTPGDAPIKSSAPIVSYKNPVAQEPNLSAKKEQASVRPGISYSNTQIHPNNSSNAPIFNMLAGYKFKLCCDECLIFTGIPWEYTHRDFKHFCTQHKLAFHIHDGPVGGIWLMVRERSSHRTFTGNYNLCHSVEARNPGLCRMHLHCSFAHNPLEQFLWQQEKEGNFSIADFIIKHKHQPPRGSMTADSVKELVVMYGGYFRYICRVCFFSSVVSSKGNGGTCSGTQRHVWASNHILAHVHEGKYTIIDHPKFAHQGAYYRLCKFLGFCERWSQNSCGFAHSKVEMSVWRLERDWSIPRDDIIKQSIQLFQANHVQTPPPAYSAAPKAYSTTSASAASNSSSDPPMSSPKRNESKPPVKMSEFCRMCWRNGQRSVEDGKKDKCVKGHNHFAINSVFIAQTTGKEVHSIPNNLFPGMKLVMCTFGNKCTRSVCTHPHSQEEMDTWNFMLRNNVKSLKAITERLREIEKANTRKIAEGESVVNVGSSVWQSQAKPLNEIIAPGDQIINEHYCNYCSASCRDQRQWDDHCASEKHKDNVNWDKEHQWNYRQPPWGQGNSLSLCPSHLHNKSCRYSHVTMDMYNFCKYAHSQEELDEWKERLEFRKMKRNMARQKHMFSFTDSLLEDYNSSENSVEVLCENLPGVKIKCAEDFVIYKEEKNATFSWTFMVSSNQNLQRVGLLRHQDRLHFFLIGENGSRHQVASGDMFLAVDERSGKHFYKIQVSFTAGLFGSFSQWVAFDFGSKPVLLKKLSVEVGSRSKQIQLEELRQDLSFMHWTSQNQRIVRCTNNVVDEFDQQILQRYKEPQESEAVVTSDSFRELNENNYTHKMHKLLELEEMTRQRIIARYNLESRVEVVNRIEESGAFIIASHGDVFLKAILPEALTEDTQAGELLLKSVRTVLLAIAGSKPTVVYEAQVVGESNYNYDGRCKDRLYIVVCASSAQALSLLPGRTMQLEIQFVMNRQFFCHMHYALDSVNETTLRDICFPDVNRFKSMQGREVNVSSSVLNESQMAAVSHIVKDRKSYTPPFVMYGPFGTGKTETLAQATMALLKDKKPHRVLICTQSNSAADLYITKHFDKFVKSKSGKYKILRIYDKRRRTNTVSPIVLPYCYKADHISFALPSKDYILNHQVVLITVESSLQLNVLGLQHEFTHIFIDEAGQALECEALMPLTLAAPNTCVVLTGDHVQISPTVYSQEARKQKFEMSMLVRLYNFYDQVSSANIVGHPANHTLKSPFNIFLSINYRTKAEILRFISTIFYGGPDHLKAYGKIPPVLSITPLTFYAVQGKEMQMGDTTSYLNQAEAEEAVAQVRQLLNEWPEEWGERKADTIAIITAYIDQVRYIRHMLKIDRTPLRKELGQVYVGGIQGVQGKEFRALFISTVRTTNILTADHLTEALKGGDDIGDLGFLSNPKLINTALTRAQSLVAVVGDAVALCMIGECIQEWRTYIKHCHNMGSLHPQSHTYDFIRSRVVELQMGPQGWVIEHLSRMGQEKLKQSFPPLQPVSRPLEDEETGGNLFGNSMEHQQHPGGDMSEYPLQMQREIEKLLNPNIVEARHLPPQGISEARGPRAHTPDMPAFPSIHDDDSVVSASPEPPRLLSMPDVRSSISSSSSDQSSFLRHHQRLGNDVLTLNHNTSCEDIIFELARESQSSHVNGHGNGIATIKSDSISVTEDNGFVLLQYGSGAKKMQPEPFKIVSEDEDFVTFTRHDQDSNKKVEYENWGIEKLKSHMRERGYLKCKLCSHEKRVFASVLSADGVHVPYGSDLVGKDVLIPSWFDQGHAFIGDEVLVKLYPQSTDDLLTGQVKGILRRAYDPSDSLVVCQGDLNCPGILTPIQKNLPSIYALTIASRKGAAEKGNVCIYKFTSAKCIEFSHYEKLFHSKAASSPSTSSSSSSQQRLFIVRYLTWSPGLTLPIGLVIGVLEPGDTLERGMKILELEYNTGPPLAPQAQEEATLAFEQTLAANSDKSHRVDLTASFCFSIAEEGRDEVDMAISIEEVEGSYNVAVHTSDVAKFIDKDSALDQECELRSASFYPAGSEPKHMLPVKSCLDICSLKTNAPHLAVTVMIRMDQLGNQLGHPQVFHSVIEVKQRFSLTEVQDIVQDPEEAQNDYYKSCILVLFQLAQMWRVQRLGNSHFNSDLSLPQKLTQHAHLMVNELEHYFNAQVASLLLNVFKTAVPLQIHPQPCADKLMQWRKENAMFALNCIPMSRDFLDKQVCHCTRACTCIFSFMRQHRLHTSHQVSVLKEAWLALCQAILEEYVDMEYIRDVISNADNLPESYVSALKFAEIQQKPYFACSDHLLAQEKEHYSLCLPGYTFFTRPLRSFISLVVQRLLKAYAEGKKSPYTGEEIAEICYQTSFKSNRLAQLLSDVSCLNLGVTLQKMSLVTKAVVESVNEKEITFHLMGMKNVYDEKLNLALSTFDPIRINFTDDINQKSVKLLFEERIYSHTGNQSNTNSSVTELEPHRFVCCVPSKDWQELLFNARETAQDDAGEKESHNLIHSIQKITQLLGGEKELSTSQFPEILSDVNQVSHVPFSLLLQPSQYLQVQITSCMQDGLLKPTLQLLSLTQKYDFCLEHRHDPEKCFSLMHKEQSSNAVQAQSHFSDLNEYQSMCLNTLASETAYQTVASGERVMIHGVNISWSLPGKASLDNERSTIFGEFVLSKEFCERVKFQPKAEEECPNSCLAFLCVRYSNMKINRNEFSDENVASLFNGQEMYTWVGHCVVTSIRHVSGSVGVKIQLSQSSVKIPEVLLCPGGNLAQCTVEWIERVKEHRVLDEMVRSLNGASDFAKEVILGRRPSNSIDPLERPSDIGLLEHNQMSVLEESYREPISVIHGAPGTGKTHLASLLASLFALRNKRADAFRRIEQDCGTQVLVCAPTEKALDTVTGYIQGFMASRRQNLNLLRVYSEEVEESDFPMPGSQNANIESKVNFEDVMKNVALHHLIRQRENAESKAILEYEFLAIYEKQPSQMGSIKEAIERAQVLELKKADIILCTCLTSARPILKRASSIKQVILDDSNMMSELVCLVPPVLHKSVNQLVLIGDQRMPSPIVYHETGVLNPRLKKSLFDRYCDSTKTMLTEQSRSMNSLIQFPSKYFYSGVLTSSSRVSKRQSSSLSLPWPCDKGFYSLFCHVEDDESGAGLGGDLDRISNQSEASFVMSLAKALNKYCKVEAKSIMVVTFSESQCALLKSMMPSGIRVSTVLESAGQESDYVIVSTVRSVSQNRCSILPSSEGNRQYFGSLVNPSYVNLAITRACSAMIIVGNKDLLKGHEPWKSLLQFYNEKHAIQANSQDYLISLMV